MTPPYPSHRLEFDADGRDQRKYGVWTLDHLREVMHHLFVVARELLSEGHAIQIIIRPMRGISWDQMKKLNAMCGDLAKQVIWHGERLNKKEWRRMLVASYRNDSRVVIGLNGEKVVLGGSSRDLSRREASEVIEMMLALGAQQDPQVRWTDPKEKDEE